MENNIDKKCESSKSDGEFILGHVFDGKRYPFIVSCENRDDIFHVEFYDLVCGSILHLTTIYDKTTLTWAVDIMDNPYMTEHEREAFAWRRPDIYKIVNNDRRNWYIERIGKATYSKYLLIELSNKNGMNGNNPYESLRNILLCGVEPSLLGRCNRLIEETFCGLIWKTDGIKRESGGNFKSDKE